MSIPGDTRCDRALETLSARMDDEVSSFESTALDAHLASCRRCAAVEMVYEHHHRRLRVRLARAIPDLSGPILKRSLRPLPLRRELARLLLGAAVVLVAFCGALLVLDSDGEPDLEVAEAMVLPARPGQDTAMYLTLVNRGGDDELTGVTSDVARQAALHSHDTYGGEVVMASSGSHPVSARAATTLAPGEEHVMLKGLHTELRPGDEVTVTLQFSSSADATVTVEVVSPEEAAPGGPRT